MKPRESLVRRKVKLTLLFAGIGSLISFFGWAISLTPITATGLVIVATSPYLSLALVLRRLKKEAT